MPSLPRQQLAIVNWTLFFLSLCPGTAAIFNFFFFFANCWSKNCRKDVRLGSLRPSPAPLTTRDPLPLLRRVTTLKKASDSRVSWGRCCLLPGSSGRRLRRSILRREESHPLIPTTNTSGSFFPVCFLFFFFLVVCFPFFLSSSSFTSTSSKQLWDFLCKKSVREVSRVSEKPHRFSPRQIPWADSRRCPLTPTSHPKQGCCVRCSLPFLEVQPNPLHFLYQVLFKHTAFQSAVHSNWNWKTQY